MNRQRTFHPLLAKLRGPHGKTAVILLLSSILPPTWVYFGSARFYLEHWGRRAIPWGDAAAAAGAYTFLTAFVLFGLIPALVVKCVFRQRLADYGVGLGDRFLTVRSFLVLAPAIVLMAWLSSRLPAIRAYFPINRSAGASPGMFAFHAATLVLCCLGWEFYFRGFMQFGLRSRWATSRPFSCKRWPRPWRISAGRGRKPTPALPRDWSGDFSPSAPVRCSRASCSTPCWPWPWTGSSATGERPNGRRYCLITSRTVIPDGIIGKTCSW